MAKSRVTLGERIKDLRQRAGLTLQQLSEQTGLTRSGLGHLETGYSMNPSIWAVSRLASAFGLTVDELLNKCEQK